MATRIGRDLVGKVAQLAGLELEEDETERLVAELGKVLDHFASLERLDVSAVDADLVIGVQEAPLRADEVRPGLLLDDALANAPAAEEGAFVVPRILAKGKVPA
jgi:aspartyl-tRNA(Asn)/glutamyl-tRNA(Gln) amidotransferase subunit C